MDFRENISGFYKEALFERKRESLETRPIFLVIPAQAGIHASPHANPRGMDPRLRGDDNN